jgi:VWFA-related protein
LIVLGPGRIQVPAKGIDGAITFVRKHLLPQDVVAVFAFNRASAFTKDHEQVAQLLDRYRRSHERLFFEVSQFRLRNPFTDLPDSIQKQLDAVFDPLPTRNGVELLLHMDGQRPLNEPLWNRQPTLADLQDRAYRDGRRLSDLLIGSPSLKLHAGIEYLRQVEGQRHLVWLGSGLGIRSVDDDKRMAARANDARVVINIIHTVGVDRSVTGWDISSAENITELTGGYFTGLTYADTALGRVDNRTRFSYLIGYTPSEASFDGKYRQVKVVVNRPGMSVMFQHGYYAVEDLPALERREVLTAARLASAGSLDEVLRDIKLNVTASPASVAAGRTTVAVAVTLDASRLSLTPDATRRSGGVEVQVFCGDSRQRLVGDLRQRVDLNLDEQAYERVLRDGILVRAQVPVTAPAKFVKVVVYDYGADRLGSFFLTMK